MMPTYYPTVSEYLSELLDDIGLDMETVKKKRNIYLKTEQMWSEMCTVYEVTVHHFGSQTEGTTTKGLNSDLDSLTCFNNVNVIGTIKQWKKGKLNLLVESNQHMAPGYCRLRCLKNDITMYETEKRIFDGNHTFDGDCVYLKNSYILSITEVICKFEHYEFIKKGPSGSGTDQIDFVTAFRYRGQCNRQKISIKWPNPSIMDTAMECDNFIVPVGHPDSETDYVEWRVSSSLAERTLMFSLNETQLKCYVMMKMIKETLFRPCIGDCLTSYHCKNALFYTIANTDKTIWSPDHLLLGIHLALVTLLSFLRNRFCPQFFNRRVNLFTGKVTKAKGEKLIHLIECVLQNQLTIILEIMLDDIGNSLTRRMTPMFNFTMVTQADQCDYESAEIIKRNKTGMDCKAWKKWLALHFVFVTEFSRYSGSYIAKYIVELSHTGFKVSCYEPDEHSQLDVVHRFTKDGQKIPPIVKLKFKEIIKEMHKDFSGEAEDKHLVRCRTNGRITYKMKKVIDVTEDDFDIDYWLGM